MLLQHIVQPKGVENRFKPVPLWFSICFKPVQLLDAANYDQCVFCFKFIRQMAPTALIH